MTYAIGNPQLYLNQITRQARHVMELYHQGKHEAVRIQEHRLAGLSCLYRHPRSTGDRMSRRKQSARLYLDVDTYRQLLI